LNPGLKFLFKILFIFESKTLLPASPPLMALYRNSGFSPAFSPKTRASEIAAIFIATIIYITGIVNFLFMKIKKL